MFVDSARDQRQRVPDMDTICFYMDEMLRSSLALYYFNL